MVLVNGDGGRQGYASFSFFASLLLSSFSPPVSSPSLLRQPLRPSRRSLISPLPRTATDAYEAAASTLEPQSAKSHRQAAADEAIESHTHGPEATKSTTEKIKVRFLAAPSPCSSRSKR